MDSLQVRLLQVDWDGLDHAYGRALDAPGQLLALIGDDSQAQSRAVGYLDAAMLHQGSVFSATGPFIRLVAAVLADPATAVVVDDILPWDPGPRPLRAALLDYLTEFAQACRLETSDEALFRDAYPVGRDEGDLQRIRDAARACDWRLDPDPATRTPPPAALVEAMDDIEYCRAMEARDLLACREIIADVFDAACALTADSESAVRTSAMTVATYCLKDPTLGDRKAALVDVMKDAAALSSEPRERAAVARLLGELGQCPETLLHDGHPGVRACAALAPGFADDPRAIRELVAALETPQETDRWFTGHLPGQEGRLHGDLAAALADRADDLEAVLPAVLGLATLSATLDYGHDLAPFVHLAFPEPLTEDSVLTAAQRTFLDALLDNQHPPFDEALCRRLLAT
ncbi:hypothetical protein ACWDA7_49655 [Streptomyces sp. NPDC001156]